MEDQNYLRKVREQYENYPYPYANPESEKTLLNATLIDRLDLINHYHYAGRNDFAQGYEVMVAGGGTGNSVIFLAEQLRDKKNARVVYLDFSESSMEVAKERAKIRKLNNIVWVHASILDIPKLDLGKFDYISCTGVLHHLENPSAGLDALASVLKEDGLMAIMVYGKNGRAAVYQIQELMAMINFGEENMQTKVDNCKIAINSLSSLHIFNKMNDSIKIESDIDIYDLFLHSQDKAYSVLDLYRFVNASNLQISKMFAFRGSFGDALYDPEVYIKDDRLTKKISAFNPVLKKAIAEAMHGHVPKHDFFVVKKPVKFPTLDEMDNIPSLSISSVAGQHADILNIIESSKIVVRVPLYGIPDLFAYFEKTPNCLEIFKLMDGNNTVGEIIKGVQKNSSSGAEDILDEIKSVFYAFNVHNAMFTRHKSVAKFKPVAEMQERVSKFYRDNKTKQPASV